MSLKQLPYKKLEPLIKNHLSTEEYCFTQELIDKLRVVKKRGYLTPSELDEICYWKSARAIGHIQSNSYYKIRTVTKKVLTTRSERLKFELLTSLSGVSVPMASAILMLTNPKRYGVIDIRVWKLLYRIGSVKTNPNGTNFKFNEWYRYLMIIRYFAKKFKVKARDIERTLFIIHKKYKKGRLYG